MVTTSKSMHREVQINNDLMTHKCNIDGLKHETSGLCEKTNRIYIVFTSCNHSHVQVIFNNILFVFSHKPLVSCPSMCTYINESLYHV